MRDAVYETMLRSNTMDRESLSIRSPQDTYPNDEWRALTRRQQEVLLVLLDTGSVSGTIEAMQLSPNTVRNHLKAIYLKYGVHSSLELACKVLGTLGNIRSKPPAVDARTRRGRDRRP